MPETLNKTPLKEKLLAAYRQNKQELIWENTSLNGFRENAADSFEKTGFPTKKNEEYKYISFDKVLHSGLEPIFSANDLNAPLFDQAEQPVLLEDAYRVVMNNGFFQHKYSLLDGIPEGVEIGSLADAVRNKNVHVLSTIGTLAKTDADPFLALNSALFADGLFIYIPKNVVLDKPIQIIQWTGGNEPFLVQPRLLIMAEQGSQAQFVQTFLSEPGHDSFSNSVSEIQVEQNATVTWISLQVEGSETSQVNTTEAHVKRNGLFNSIAVTLGGKLVRNNLNIVLDSPDCEAHLYGYYHPNQDQVFDNHTLVDHKYPDGRSNELYKGVADGNGTAVFNGKVFVRPDAQKTNAFQSNKNILLTDEASIFTKPQLEIYADDVKCSHGSSTGFIDPEQLFYLRSRGISVDRAQALLLNAYAGEILDQIKITALRDAVFHTVTAGFSQL